MKLPNKIIVAAGFMLLLLNNSHAQKTYRHGVFWGRLVLADTVNKKLKWELYLQKRTQNIPGHKSIFGGPHFTSIWFWLNYQLNKEVRLSVSPFGYFNSNLFFTKDGDQDLPGVKEFRWVTRIEYEKKGWLNYFNRYSVEYRLRDIKNNKVYLPNWRMRYQLRFEKLLNNVFSKTKPVSVSVGDEIFVQFGRAVRGNANVFDQNRITAGFSYELLKNIKTGLYYVNIRQQRINGTTFDNAHVLWVILTFDNLFSQFRKQQTTN